MARRRVGSSGANRYKWAPIRFWEKDSNLETFHRFDTELSPNRHIKQGNGDRL
jgi:hypothetical protein